MKIQIASDIHLELNSTCKDLPEIIPKAPILVLAGDIGIVSKQEYYEIYCAFLKEQSKQFEIVFVLAGNHEFYGGEYNQCIMLIEKACNTLPNVLFMNRTSYLYENKRDKSDRVRVLGCTLWSNVPYDVASSVENCLNDYRRIQINDGNTTRNLTVQDTNAMHDQDVEFLENEIEKAEDQGENVCVLTHHGKYIQYISIDCKLINSLSIFSPFIHWNK
jgi:predicted MPP superfamily phosphohydrolase